MPNYEYYTTEFYYRNLFQAITTLIKGFPKTMFQWLPEILPSVWSIFTQSADMYPYNFLFNDYFRYNHSDHNDYCRLITVDYF